MTASPVEMVLFDLGGVLVELQGVTEMGDLCGISDDEELWRRWLSCRWVRRFEGGGCTGAEFAQGVVDDWGLAISPEAYLDRFRAWPTGPLPGAEALVAEVAGRVPTGCFSNTNPLHFEEFRHWPLLGWLDHRYLSFELGALKPDVAAFERVAAAIGRPPERVLFLDDNQLNVDGARQAGFAAQRARGVAEARAALAAAGVIDR